MGIVTLESRGKGGEWLVIVMDWTDALGVAKHALLTRKGWQDIPKTLDDYRKVPGTLLWSKQNLLQAQVDYNIICRKMEEIDRKEASQ